MIHFLIKKFIKNYNDVTDKKVRESYSILSGCLGIFCNLVLFTIKIIVGNLMNSIAIISDAFNNLSDTGSSFIVIIGAKMSNRRPDKEHPFGHGRIEYISSLIVSFLIMLMGLELAKSSFDKILHPEPIAFDLTLTIILLCSVFIKVWMFSYNRYIGKKINAVTITATARDSLNDVIATLAVIVCTLIGYFFHFNIDGYIGIVVSALIIYTGFSVAKDTVTLLLGAAPDPELIKNIEEMVLNTDGIIGVHDLIVHDYGPGRIIASVHAEIPSDSDIIKIHEAIDRLEHQIHETLNVLMVIHMDPVLLHCEKTDRATRQIQTIIDNMPQQLSFHDLRITDGENNINLIFDVVVPVGSSQKECDEIVQEITTKLKQFDPRYNAVINIDNSY